MIKAGKLCLMLRIVFLGEVLSLLHHSWSLLTSKRQIAELLSSICCVTFRGTPRLPICAAELVWGWIGPFSGEAIEGRGFLLWAWHKELVCQSSHKEDAPAPMRLVLLENCLEEPG